MSAIEWQASYTAEPTGIPPDTLWHEYFCSFEEAQEAVHAFAGNHALGIIAPEYLWGARNFDILGIEGFVKHFDETHPAYFQGKDFGGAVAMLDFGNPD
jgi:hypothetical protein